jgi:hypothetical protein
MRIMLGLNWWRLLHTTTLRVFGLCQFAMHHYMVQHLIPRRILIMHIMLGLLVALVAIPPRCAFLVCASFPSTISCCNIWSPGGY